METSNLKGMRTPHLSTWKNAGGGSLDSYPVLAEKLRHLIEKHSGQGARIFDDFTANALNTTFWTYAEGTDSATAGNSIVAAGEHALRLTTGDAGTGFAADACQITGPACFTGAKGLLFRTRFRSNLVTVAEILFGFTDSASLEDTVSIGASDALTTVATDCVVAKFDTAADTDEFFAVGVQNDVDSPDCAATGYAPVADTWEEWEIFVDGETATAYFYRNGALVATVTDAVTLSVALFPIFQVSNVSGTTSHLVDIDYLEVIALSR